MSYSGTPTLYGERQIAAAYQSGTRLPVTQIAVGDGAGAAVQPTEGMTALVNEVYRAPITSWGVDPADTRRIVVRATIPATAGPFVVREAGVFDVNGGMIAVTALAATEIVAPGTSNQATSIDLIVALPIGSAGAITVSPTLGERFTIERLLRTPFISINSAAVATPPANPAVGDLYILPASPQGAWATATVGTIAEWNGIFWAFLVPPLKMVAGIMDQVDDGAVEYLKWTGTAWEPFALDGVIYAVTDNGNSTPDDFVGTTAPGLLALQPNMVFRFRQGAQANQTSTPKANIVNAVGTVLAAAPFSKADGSQLVVGDLPAKADFLADWDGTLLRVFGQRPSDTAATATAVASSTASTVASSTAAAVVTANTPAIIAQTSIGKNLAAFTTPGTYTFVVPSKANGFAYDVTQVYATVIAAGGGAPGGSVNGVLGAPGGGAGETREGWVSVTPGQSITIVVGLGSPGTPYATNAANGGTSSFGSAITAIGGGGGVGNPPSGGAGGSGGTGGQFALPGGNGGDGDGSGNNNFGGNGGASSQGGGGRASTVNSSLCNGRAYGSGAGGIYGKASNTTGGSGAGAAVFVQF